MLTVAYCRVSTEEQATEGFSIGGQTEKLRAYAALHDLGPVTVIEDPGLSGKDTNRPGLQRLLKAVDDGHVTTVLIWRLDRLSRDLGDLIVISDRLGAAGVGLVSFTEQLDLTSATGRMFFHILGAFAQFYREQLAENVRMGQGQAVRQGRWINRPKTGYDLIDGALVPNSDAAVVRHIFQLRAEGASHREIEAATGVNYSTARGILLSRIYLGEVQHKDQWFPGQHEPLISPEEFASAQRGYLPGRRQSKDLLSGHVRCGLCGRAASVQYNRQKLVLYRCHHRGTGCVQPARSGRGLLRGALLGLKLIGTDEHLREAIRRQLRGPGRPARQGGSPGRQQRASSLGELSRKRQKLLDLYYSDKISADLFAQEEQRLVKAISAATSESEARAALSATQDELTERFEQVAQALRELDMDVVWAEADEAERRVLVDELVDQVAFFPDHLEVTVAGAPRLNVMLSEVGLKESRTVGVEGGT